MLLLLLLCLLAAAEAGNLPPVFIADMDNLALSESTPVGSAVYTLRGQDPEGLPVKFGVSGTDVFTVDEHTGVVTLAAPLDREKDETLKFFASVKDVVAGSHDNVVTVPVTVIVLDENDNAPVFKNSPYEVDVLEDSPVGTTILDDIRAEDGDTVGETLEVACVASSQANSSSARRSDACAAFEIVAKQSSQNEYRGALVLKSPLDYNAEHSYLFRLYAYDGLLNSTANVEVRVVDVQNRAPVFSGSLAAVLSEDAPIGTEVLTVQAKDGDRAHPRGIVYDLLTNPHDYFVLDAATGELRTGKPLDRESLPDASSPLELVIRAREVIDDRPADGPLTSATATVTVNIRDVNDEPPRFNRKEYSVEIPENVPFGTPLPNLDMFVSDADVGANSEFSLRLSDVSGAFRVEPVRAVGSTQVSIRLGDFTLDYENPNQRKFIVLVIAEELHTEPRLSSTATVRVTVTDANDNSPVFKQTSYSATASERAAPGTRVLSIVATDRDHARSGTEGIVYEISGNGADLFLVDNRTGTVVVAFCPTPGEPPCLDYETRPDYFLNYKATDDDGEGLSTVVPLKISLYDTNDNPPRFLAPVYVASVDEGATEFDPELRVEAVDPDKTSTVTYSIVNATEDDLFVVDPVSGKMSVRQRGGLDATIYAQDRVVLTVRASDGEHDVDCQVKIAIRDVNDNPPVFETDQYEAVASENSPLGASVARVAAVDADSGVNSQIKYSIQAGAFDDFSVEPDTGVVRIASKLDYDRRKSYRMQIVAADLGVPALTGTAALMVTVLNENDKTPYFAPQIQRTEVSVDAEIGTAVHKLIAADPDARSPEDLEFRVGYRPITAVDKNGKQVSDDSAFRRWFTVETDGRVLVAESLDRNAAAIVSLPVSVRDLSADGLQESQGVLVVTVVDVNASPPSFRQTSFVERFSEEQPIDAVLTTFHATDDDSAVSHYSISPPNQYFQIDNITGTVRSKQRIDYERVHQINFTVVAYDAGVPQLSASVPVTVNVGNVNDEVPVFDESMYDAKLEENSPAGALVLTVRAVDKDEGVFGEVRYSVSGERAELFVMDSITGELRVATGATIDRESVDDVWLQARAVDNAPVQARKTANVPIHIEVTDVNDNPPVFGQRTYKASVAENLSLNPPTPILQVRAEDKDVSVNGQIEYAITEQTEEGAFALNSTTGILYPARPLRGNTAHRLTVTAVDGFGSGPHSDAAYVDINVESVNQHSPVWVAPLDNQPVLNIPENLARADEVLITIRATDEDSGENGRISYYLKVGNKNVHETNEFALDENTGELRTKAFLDREQRDTYKLALVATDRGSPSRLEVIKFLTINLNDSNDNRPFFAKASYDFYIEENQPSGTTIGTIKATDKDTGENGKVYYYIIKGNDKEYFTVDKTQGILRADRSLDREEESEYSLVIRASNDPALRLAKNQPEAPLGASDGEEGDFANVRIKILDLNDNPPRFERSAYYAGVKSTAKVNELILPVKAKDPDSEANGEIEYAIKASNVYKFGETHSSGSVVPSPFNITNEGLLVTAGFVAEYNQDRFVLNVVAREARPPHREADTDVYVWIVRPEQLIKMEFSESCARVNEQQSRIASGLSNFTGSIVVIAAMKHYARSDHRDGCDLYMHMVDPDAYSVLPADQAIKRIDEQYDQLKELYEETGILDLVEFADASTKGNPETFDPALAALVALLIVLFTGIVTFVVVCSCLKQWVLPLPGENGFKEKGSAKERSRRLLQELSSTENPLWAEHKLRLYEEQELTMNVFGENAEAYNHQRELPPVGADDMYATIQGGGGERDYATLNGPRNLGANLRPQTGTESAASFEAMLGFQGSTFQPELPVTPEPPPRSNFLQNSSQ